LKRNYFKLKEKKFTNNLNRLSVNEFNEHVLNFKYFILPFIVKNSGMKCILEHKKRNTDVCIVSASFEFLLNDWCLENKLMLISNKILLKDYDFRITGVDCNYENKLIKISEMFELSKYDYIYAYGDSSGDLSMLSIANEKFFNHFN
jgi:HAD superfamily phosphoserine phosphatase-like hydrolase